MPLKSEDLTHIVGDDVVASCDAVSLETRYAGAGLGGLATFFVLRRLAARTRRDDAIDLPANVTVATTAHAAFVVGYRRVERGRSEPYVVVRIARDALDAPARTGLMWTRVDLVDRVAGRSAQVFLGRITPGRSALLAALAALSPPPAPPVAAVPARP